MAGGTANLMAGPQSEVGGPIRAAVGEFDGVITIPGAIMFGGASAVLTATRRAAGDWVGRRTAAAQTDVLAVPISTALLEKWGTDPMRSGFNFGIVPDNPLQNPKPAPLSSLYSRGNSPIDPYPFGIGHVWRGFQLVGLDVVYNVATDVMTAILPHFYQRQSRNNAAPLVVADPGGPYTINNVVAVGWAGAVDADDQIARIVFNTPYIIGANDATTDDWLELEVEGTATGVLDIVALYLKVNYNLL